MKLIAAALISATLTAAFSPTASAATTSRQENVNAAGICEAAFSNQTVRNRPTGVRNTGTTSIYVTCSDDGYWSGSGAHTDEVYIRLANFGAAAVTVGCSLQPGWTNGVTNTTVQGSFSKSTSLNPNEYDWLTFEAASYPATATDGFQNVNFTCLLPPNVEIQYMGREFTEDVGL